MGESKTIFASCNWMEGRIGKKLKCLHCGTFEIGNNPTKIGNNGTQDKLFGSNLRGPNILSMMEGVGDGLDNIEGKSCFGVSWKYQQLGKGWIVISIGA